MLFWFINPRSFHTKIRVRRILHGHLFHKLFRRAKNPSDGKGQRKYRHHQWLTDDVGHPALAQHMYALIGFMRAEDEWHTFKRRFERAYPKRGDTLPLF